MLSENNMEANNNTTSTNGVPSRSKAEILRGLLAETLSTAGQDICAAVETTCAGYEEEASALKVENERQKKMLTVLLQPEIKLETAGTEESSPDCEPAGGGRGRRRRRGKRARGPSGDEDKQNSSEPSETLSLS